MREGVRRGVFLLLGVLVLGTLGYRAVSGADWWDAFYMTVITLTTVGYREVVPLGRAGQAFTVVLLFAGLGILFFALTDLGRWVLHGELRGVMQRARRSRMIESLSDHEIVCGWGRMGQAVVAELRRVGRGVVVIERSGDKVARLEEAGVPVVHGDATLEATLRAAGIQRARGLVACLNDDAHNVYTILAARSANPALFIVARATEAEAEARLAKVGADRVVNPYHLGGVRLAHELLGEDSGPRASTAGR